MTAALLVKRAGADEYGSKTKVLIGGDAGSGKTRIASTWPDPIYANAEGGLMSVVDRHPHFVDITSLDDLSLLFVALRRPAAEQEKLLGFVPRTLVLDTIDEIQRLAARQRLDETKKESLAIQDFGWLGDQMRGIIRAARNLDMHVVMTVHLKPDRDEETGRVLIKPQLQGAMADEIASYVDLALLLKTQQSTRVVDGQSKRVEVRLLQTVSDSNHTWLKDRSGKLARPDFEVNLEDDFDRIHSRIFGGTIEASMASGSIPAANGKESKEAKAKATKPATKATVTAPPTAAPITDVAPDPEPEPPAEPELADSPPEEPTAEEPSVETPPEVEPEPEDLTVAEPAADEPSPDIEETSSEPLHDRVTLSLVGAESAEAPVDAPTDEIVPAGGTPAEGMTCESCGGAIESDDQRDLSRIRFRKDLCRTCFTTAKKR